MLTRETRELLRQRIDQEVRKRKTNRERLEREYDDVPVERPRRVSLQSRPPVPAAARAAAKERTTPMPPPGPVWTRDQIIDAIKQEARQTGSFPTASAWQKPAVGRPTYTAVRKHFSSWADALKAAGYPTHVVGLVRVEPDGKIIVLENGVASEYPPSANGSAAPAHPREPEPDQATDPVGANPSFADVAEELEHAREQRDQALAAYSRAVDRFKAHPLYQQLRTEELA